MTCAACGLHLPAGARFCARCGTPQPPRRQAETWVLALFGFGIVLTAGIAVVYGGLAISPVGTPAGMDPGAVRTTAAVFCGVAALLCALQCVALAGLATGREWGRALATASSVAWALTCVGIPVALLVLGSIWRRRPDAVEPGGPLPGRPGGPLF